MTENVPVAALVSGEIDYHTALGTSVRAGIQGLPLRVVAAYGEGSGWVRWPAVPVLNRYRS
jgi:hypothetical protein